MFCPKVWSVPEFWTLLGLRPSVDFQWNKLYKALWNVCDLGMLAFAKQIELSGINWVNICKAHCIMPGTQQVLYKCLTNKWEALLWTKEGFICASRKMDESLKDRYNGVQTADSTVQFLAATYTKFWHEILCGKVEGQKARCVCGFVLDHTTTS